TTSFGRRNDMMNRKKKMILAAIFGPPALVAFIALGGELVKLLWNWLLPPIFGWHLITFWQALGLLALCRILFGGFSSGHGPGSGMRRRMRERWENMTPEEREKLRQACQNRRGQTSPPDPSMGV